MSKLTDNKEGIYSLMLTPFNEDRSIDYNAYENYCDWQIAQGVQHLFCVCGSSEMTQLKLEERIKLATLTAKHKGDVTIVATANLEPSWFAQVEEVKKMSQTGVDGLVFTTKGFGDNDDRLVTYIEELATHTELPVFLYEFPGFQPHKMTGDAYGRLAKKGIIQGIKDTTCTIEGIKAKIDQKYDSCIIQANMPFLFEAFKLGARGVMSTPTTCGGAFFTRFFEAFTSGDMALAEKRHQEIMLLDGALEGGFCATAKELVRLQGCQMNWYQRSATVLSAQKLHSLKTFHDWSVANGLMK